jgi:hypothetical protein
MRPALQRRDEEIQRNSFYRSRISSWIQEDDFGLRPEQKGCRSRFDRGGEW